MNENDNKLSKKMKNAIIGTIVIAITVPMVIFLVLHLFMVTYIDEMASLDKTLYQFKTEYLTIVFVSYGMIVYYIGNYFYMRKPKKSTQLASERWMTEKELEKSFTKIPIDPYARIDVGGIPISKISDYEMLYDPEVNQTLTIATTRGGKSRKIVVLLIFICAMARESILCNDPKKELYKMLKSFLVSVGYKVWCLDFRFLEYSDHKNPMDRIINFFKEDDIDEADQAAQDLVETLVVDNGAGEKIWIDGQKAMTKAILLAVGQANIPDNKKNFYSVYQTLAVRGNENTFNGDTKNRKMELTAYMEYLDEDNVARTAFAPIRNSPEKTRGSFMTSTLSTLQLFSSRKLNRVIGKSDFQFKDFAEGKIALFIVNPDEKSTYDKIASIMYDQSYQEFVEVANKNGGTINRRIHNIFDEAGNMSVIKDLDKKLTVSLGRGILYHLFIQSYAQLNKLYEDSGKKTIVDNTITKFFISSGDYDTCEEMSRRIGEETIWQDSQTGQLSQNASPNGGSIQYSQSKRRLLDANELLSSDLRSGKGIILTKTYNHPARVYLPDISKYEQFYKEMDNPKKYVETPNPDRELLYAVPRWIVITENELMGKPEFPMQALRIGMNSANHSPYQKDMYWYWSMNSNLANQVKEHIMEKIKHSNFTMDRKSIKNYLLTKEFQNFMNSIDIVESETNKESVTQKSNNNESTLLSEMMGD
ncbi:MAG: type IV secretory system conjugative DNA transfer family protein [Coprobacillus sp.]|nr:type IV secretory system conjugative DNA transfer family protein [Coprobacillus sp.]